MQLPHTPSMRLDGKRALVVGASSGIGLACATALAEVGAEVTIASRRLAPLEALAQAIHDRGGIARPVVLDVADVGTTAAVVSELGPFDVLLNSAGLAIHSPALETQVADYDAVMGLNVRGAYFLTREVARGLIGANKPGSLINISSQMSVVGGIDRAVYCASKHALEGFTKSMAIEWGQHGIRVNTICPTFLRTPLTEQTFSNPERVKWIEEKIKLGCIGKMEDVMGAAIYLATDASSLVTGSSMMVDGGWTAD